MKTTRSYAYDVPIEMMHPLVVSTVYQLYQRGQSLEQISTTMTVEHSCYLSVEEVDAIIDRKNDSVGIS